MGRLTETSTQYSFLTVTFTNSHSYAPLSRPAVPSVPRGWPQRMKLFVRAYDSLLWASVQGGANASSARGSGTRPLTGKACDAKLSLESQ